MNDTTLTFDMTDFVCLLFVHTLWALLWLALNRALWLCL